MKFWLEGDTSVVVRPSGTEPKIKVYLSASARDREEAEKLEVLLQKALEDRMGISS